MAGEEVLFRDHIESVQHFRHHALALRALDFLVEQGRFQVFVHRKVIDQVIGLKNKADVLAMQARAVTLADLVYRLVQKKVFAGRGLIQHPEYVQERRFS